MDSFFEIRSCFHLCLISKFNFWDLSLYIYAEEIFTSLNSLAIYSDGQKLDCMDCDKKNISNAFTGPVPRLLCIIKRFRPPGILHAGAGRGSLYDVTIGK